MQIQTFDTASEMGRVAARNGADLIRKALADKGGAAIILATGASQFEMLSTLVAEPGIDWSKVTAFHLDEYIGLQESHPASFRKYLKERFVAKVPNLGRFVFVEGDALDLNEELARIGGELAKNPIDVAFVGIGENGHLAFNDPPADFDTEVPYIVVNLDEPCRRQQMGEGWFATFEDVPRQAVSMGIRQIMKSGAIICTVPDARKANAVKICVEEPVSNLRPASILRKHPRAWLYLDALSASLLSPATLDRSAAQP